MTTDTYRIFKAESEGELNAIRSLFIEYQSELGKDLSFQSFDTELNGLESLYHGNRGALLLLQESGDAEFAGCVGLKKLDDAVCEMKRLYVRPAYRSRHYGAVLAKSIIQEATQLGYSEMCLDTLRELEPAVNLYRRLGFKEIEAYYDTNPHDDVIYMRKTL